MAEKRSTEDKYALAGMAIGILTAAVVAFLFAFESSTIVRYLVMASGLVIGWAVGRAIGKSRSSGR